MSHYGAEIREQIEHAIEHERDATLRSAEDLLRIC